MSSMDFLSERQETLQQREKGVEAYLSQEEREQLQRQLGFPEEFPQKFGAWILDYVRLNGQLPRSSIVGLPNLTPGFSIVTTDQTTSNTSYTDLGTVGPQITGLGDGIYLVLFGCQMTVTANIWGGAMSIASDDTAASDANGFAIVMTTAEGAEVEAYNLPGMRAHLMTLTHGNNNTLTAKYRYVSGTNPSYSNRWLAAIRVGNA